MDMTENIRLRGIEPEVDARGIIEFSAITNLIYTRCVAAETEGTWDICPLSLMVPPHRVRETRKMCGPFASSF